MRVRLVSAQEYLENAMAIYSNVYKYKEHPDLVKVYYKEGLVS